MLMGWRQVEITGTRAKAGYARVLKSLSQQFPEAEKIVLAQDSFNMHHPSSLCEVFAPQEARRLMERFAWHYTPRHGSWLSMAEIELGILKKQCQGERMDSREELEKQMTAWQARRNQNPKPCDWQFTTAEARVKLKRLYKGQVLAG